VLGQARDEREASRRSEGSFPSQAVQRRDRPPLAQPGRAAGLWACCFVIGRLHRMTMRRSLRIAAHPKAQRRGAHDLLKYALKSLKVDQASSTLQVCLPDFTAYAPLMPASTRCLNDRPAASTPSTRPANTSTATCWRVARAEYTMPMHHTQLKMSIHSGAPKRRNK
jgi:hypothetical protein